MVGGATVETAFLIQQYSDTSKFYINYNWVKKNFILVQGICVQPKRNFDDVLELTFLALTLYTTSETKFSNMISPRKRHEICGKLSLRVSSVAWRSLQIFFNLLYKFFWNDKRCPTLFFVVIVNTAFFKLPNPLGKISLIRIHRFF